MLQAARDRREEGWKLIKSAWLDSAPEGEECVAFMAEFARADTLATAYERSVQHADTLADRLRREADRVARRAEWQSQLEEHQLGRMHSKRSCGC